MNLMRKMRNINVNGYKVYSFLNVVLAVITGLSIPVGYLFAAEVNNILMIFAGILVCACALALLIKRNMKLGEKKLIIKYTILQVLLSVFVLISAILGIFIAGSNKMDDLQSGN